MEPEPSWRVDVLRAMLPQPDPFCQLVAESALFTTSAIIPPVVEVAVV